MELNATQFHPFPRLPREIQSNIWVESFEQSDPRVYELSGYYQTVDLLSEDRTNIQIKDITLCKRSQVQRPLLQVDRTSRKENLRFYQLVEFRNASVYMNMDIDIPFLGKFGSENLIHSFRHGTFEDPFWKNIKHLAFGMDAMLRMLQYGEILGNEEPMVPIIAPFIEELKQFSALHTFILVLDGVRRTQPKVNGIVTFGDPYQVTRKRRSLGPKYHDRWMSFLCEEWESAAWLQLPLNVPAMYIKSLSRDGKLQYPCFKSVEGNGLPDWVHMARRIRDRILVEQDSSESGFEADE